MQQLIINGSYSQFFFDKNATGLSILAWVRSKIETSYENNIFDLSEPFSCSAFLEETYNDIQISGDEDFVNITIIPVDIIVV